MDKFAMDPIFLPILEAAKQSAWSDSKIVHAKTSELIILIGSATTELRNLVLGASDEDIQELKDEDPSEYVAFVEVVDLIKRQLVTATNELDARVPVARSY